VRSLGATIAMTNPMINTSKYSREGGVLSHGCLRKANGEVVVVTGVSPFPGIAVPLVISK
jgi:hypothetical protein